MPDQEQRRNGKDNPGRERLAGRGGRLDDIVLQNIGVPEHSEHGHGHHGCRNRCRHGHAGKQPEIRVRCRQHRCENDGENDRLQGDLGKLDIGRHNGGGWRRLGRQILHLPVVTAETLNAPSCGGPVTHGADRKPPPQYSTMSACLFGTIVSMSRSMMPRPRCTAPFAWSLANSWSSRTSMN